MDNLAPGVMSNILVHGVGMALIPIMTFFMLHWMGFSGVWCAINAVLMVHLCLGSFIYRAWKEEVNSGFEKKALDKDD